RRFARLAELLDQQGIELRGADMFVAQVLPRQTRQFASAATRLSRDRNDRHANLSAPLHRPAELSRAPGGRQAQARRFERRRPVHDVHCPWPTLWDSAEPLACM